MTQDHFFFFAKVSTSPGKDEYHQDLQRRNQRWSEMHFVILSSSPTSSILELAQKRPSEALEGEGESLMESKFEVFF